MKFFGQSGFRAIGCYPYLLVCGDFNYPKIDWLNLTVPGQGDDFEFLDFCIENGLDQKVTEPTHLVSNPTLLDLVLCHDSVSLSKVVVGETFCSTC